MHCAFCGLTQAEARRTREYFTEFGVMEGLAHACTICTGAELRKAYAAKQREHNNAKPLTPCLCGCGWNGRSWVAETA